MKDFEFKKSLGQNFIVDNNIIKKIIESSQFEDDSLIIEVGPGNGALTKELIKGNNKVITFEIDKRLKESLEEIKNDNLEIVFEDFLKVDINSYITKYKYSKFYFISNLPYYITTPIINKVIKETKVDKMIIMVQKEVGDRINAKPNTKSYNSLSIFLQYYFNIKKVIDVSKNSFFPKPNIDSIVLLLEKKEKINKVKNEKEFFEFVRDCFRQKRKNLRNNLKNYDLELLEKAFNKINKDLTFRAEQITLEEFVFIFNYIKNNF